MLFVRARVVQSVVCMCARSVACCLYVRRSVVWCLYMCASSIRRTQTRTCVVYTDVLSSVSVICPCISRIGWRRICGLHEKQSWRDAPPGSRQQQAGEGGRESLTALGEFGLIHGFKSASSRRACPGLDARVGTTHSHPEFQRHTRRFVTKGESRRSSMHTDSVTLDGAFGLKGRIRVGGEESESL